MVKNEYISDILDKYNFWRGQAIEFGYLRPLYLNQLELFLDSSLVKVILGQRRCGKSRLMRMAIHHLMTKRNVPARNILYINKELYAFDFIKNHHDLMETFKVYQESQKPAGKIYFFIDEVQEIETWEKAINSLSQDYSLSVELLISGSNAHL